MKDGFWILVSVLASGCAAGSGWAVAAPALDRLNARYLAGLRDRMERLGMDVGRLPLCLRLWRLAVVTTVLLVWLGLGMFPVAVFMAFVVHRVIPLWLDYRVYACRLRVRDQLVPASRNLAGQMRAGVTIEEALAALGREMPDPLGWHLRRAVNQLARGRTLRDVLCNLKARLRLEAVSVFVLTLLTASEKGGKLADVLERASRSLEEMQRIQRKRESDTASGRLMVLVLGLFPVTFLGLFYLLDRESTSLVFTMLAGQVVLAVVGLLVYVSVRWAQRILAQVE